MTLKRIRAKLGAAAPAKNFTALANALGDVAEYLTQCEIEAQPGTRSNFSAATQRNLTMRAHLYPVDPEKGLARALTNVHSMEGYKWLEAQAGFIRVKDYIDKKNLSLQELVHFYAAITFALFRYFYEKSDPRKAYVAGSMQYKKARNNAKKLLVEIRKGARMADLMDNKELTRLLSMYAAQSEAGLYRLTANRNDKFVIERRLVQRLSRSFWMSYGKRYVTVVAEIAAMVGYDVDLRNITRAIEKEKLLLKKLKAIQARATQRPQ